MDRAAIGIISRIRDELIIRRQPDRAQDVDAVEALENALGGGGNRPIADEARRLAGEV